MGHALTQVRRGLCKDKVAFSLGGCFLGLEGVSGDVLWTWAWLGSLGVWTAAAGRGPRRSSCGDEQGFNAGLIFVLAYGLLGWRGVSLLRIHMGIPGVHIAAVEGSGLHEMLTPA